MYAARQGSVDAARVLVAAGVNLDLADPDGTTALVLAIINAHYDTAKLLIESGFVDVRRMEHNMPISAAQDNQLGKLWLLACMIGVEATALRLMTKYMGWSPERVRAACEQVCDEMKAIYHGQGGRERELNIKLIVVMARKPLVPGQWSAQTMTENGQMVEYSGDESTIGS